MSVTLYNAEYAARVLREGDRSEEEKALVVRFVSLQALCDEAEKQVEAYFMPRLKALLGAKDFTAAKRLVDRAPPDCVTKVFLLDQYQQAKKEAAR